MSTPKITTDEWLAAVEQISVRELAPPGWITMREFRKRIGLGRSAAAKRMRELISEGLVEEKPYSVLDHKGRALPVPHYHLKASSPANPRSA